MRMALAISILFLSSVLVYFMYLCRPCLPSFIRESTIFSYVILSAPHVQWACDLCLSYSLNPNFNYVPTMPAETGADQPLRASDYYWKRAASENAGTECLVCQYKVEEGEDIGELICGHVFHRFCLETWVRYRNLACPLCRGPLASARSLDSEIYSELHVSQLWSSNSRDRDRLWLRL